MNKHTMKKPFIKHLYDSKSKGFVPIRQVEMDLKCPITFLEDVIKDNKALFETTEGFGDDEIGDVRLSKIGIDRYEKNLI